MFAENETESSVCSIEAYSRSWNLIILQCI